MKVTRTLLAVLAAAAAAACGRTSNPVAPADSARFSSTNPTLSDSAGFNAERGIHLIGGGN